MQSNSQHYHRACTEAIRFTKERQSPQTQRHPQPQGSITQVTLFVRQAHTKKKHDKLNRFNALGISKRLQKKSDQ